MEKKKLKKGDPMQLLAEKGDFSNKKRPKRDPKSDLETQLVAVIIPN